MLNPRDLLNVTISGDDDVGDTYSDQPGETINQGKAGYSNGLDHRILTGVAPFDDPTFANGGQLAANGENHYKLPYKPDAWYGMIPNIAGVNIELHYGFGSSPVPLGRFGGGGYFVIPGNADGLTLKNIAAVACFPIVAACSGFGELNARDIQIYPGTQVQAK